MMGMLNINCHGASRHCRGRVADGWSASLPIGQCGFGLACILLCRTEAVSREM